MRLYLDVDGVLLGRGPASAADIALAGGADDLLTFALDRFDVRWLTTHGRDGTTDGVLAHLAEFASADFLALAARVQPTLWSTVKVEAFEGSNGDFVWFDDAPLAVERQFLADRGWSDRWWSVNTRRRPDDLRQALERLRRLP